jgi:hypothetical protein
MGGSLIAGFSLPATPPLTVLMLATVIEQRTAQYNRVFHATPSPLIDTATLLPLLPLLVVVTVVHYVITGQHVTRYYRIMAGRYYRLASLAFHRMLIHVTRYYR